MTAVTERPPRHHRRPDAAAGGRRIRKATILRVAAELFASRGYAAVSVTEIAEGVGISPGAMYRHYRGKEGVLDAVMVDTVEGYAAVVRRCVGGGRPTSVASRRAPSSGWRWPARRRSHWSVPRSSSPTCASTIGSGTVR